MADAPADQGYVGPLNPTTGNGDLNAISFVVRQMIARLSTIRVVQVKAVTNSGGVSAAGTVDVLPLVSQIDGSGNVTPHGTIYGVPYFRLQGGANAVILDPAVGDIGYMVVCDRDISVVKTTKKQSPPGSRRMLDLADGIYVGGILNGVPENYFRFDSAGNIEVVSATKVTLRAPMIVLDGAVHSTGNVTGDGTAVYTGAVMGAGHSLSTHVHTSAAAGNPTGPPIG